MNFNRLFKKVCLCQRSMIWKRQPNGRNKSKISANKFYPKWHTVSWRLNRRRCGWSARRLVPQKSSKRMLKKSWRRKSSTLLSITWQHANRLRAKWKKYIHLDFESIRFYLKTYLLYKNQLPLFEKSQSGNHLQYLGSGEIMGSSSSAWSGICLTVMALSV